MAIKQTQGNYRQTDSTAMFFAVTPSVIGDAVHLHDHFLVAANELSSQQDSDQLGSWLAAGKKVLLDSGVFHLANTYARQQGISMDKALAQSPITITGYGKILERYTQLIQRYGDELWGYIEIDQGGRDHKIMTRTYLEQLGLKPIPVYHPLNDGWDYFDELAQQYDRICLGNVVQASNVVRKRILATIWQRKQAYPHLWIHALGLGMHQYSHPYPMDSYDSSTWNTGLRYDNQSVRCACATFSAILPSIMQRPERRTALCAYDAHFDVLNHHALAHARAEAGLK